LEAVGIFRRETREPAGCDNHPAFGTVEIKCRGTITEAIDLISKNATDPIALTEVDGVGDRTAKNLCEAGVTTELDVHAASDEFLLDLPGVGQKNLTNLRRHIN